MIGSNAGVGMPANMSAWSATTTPFAAALVARRNVPVEPCEGGGGAPLERAPPARKVAAVARCR